MKPTRPTYQFSGFRWAQIFTDNRMPVECGTGQRLILTNVTYEQQGQYICLASNKINGHVREVKSDPESLQVVGAPRVSYMYIYIYTHAEVHVDVAPVHRGTIDSNFTEACTLKV